MRRTLGLLMLVGPLTAAPVWKAPAELPFGRLVELELREEDPKLPAPPRPGDERLGSLLVRSVEPLPDGRGWRLRVQALRNGSLRIPALDLGNGTKTPELRLTVPRSTPFGAAWMGLGGGRDNLLPRVNFPWMWTSFLLLPLGAGILLGLSRWHRGRRHREARAFRKVFSQAWPPRGHTRSDLDLGHAAGRDLLATRFGPEARSWGPEAFEARGLPGWAAWVRSLDAARFGRSEPPFPGAAELLAELAAPEAMP